VSIAIAVACTSASADAASLTKVADFNPALGQLPESITSDGAGNLFMSMRNTVQRLTPGGVLSTYATLPVPSGVLAAGLKFDDEGDLFVATGSLHPDPPAAFIWRVDEVGAVSMHAELDPQGFPNDLAFDDHDNLFVTDPLQGRIWRVDADGEPTVWMEHPALEGDEEEPYLVLSHFGVDGIAFDKYKKWIYVSNLDYGTILRVKVKADGTAGPLEIYVDDFDALVFVQRRIIQFAVSEEDAPLCAEHDPALGFGGVGSEHRHEAELIEQRLQLTGVETGGAQAAQGFIEGAAPQ